MEQVVFKRKLDSILKDNAINRYIGGKTKGKLNTKRLYKISESKKIFRQKEERKGKDYSFTLLLDASGSMDGTRAEITETAVDKLGKVFDQIKVLYSIFTFSDVPRMIKGFDEKYNKKHSISYRKSVSRLPYTYCEACDSKDVDKDTHNCILKKHNNRKKFGTSCGGSTNDSIALHVAGDYTLKHAKKNIMIVITDGDGNNLSYYGDHCLYQDKIPLNKIANAKTVLKRIRKENPEAIILAIGISSEHVFDVYGRRYSKNIIDVNQLFDSVVSIISSNIKRG